MGDRSVAEKIRDGLIFMCSIGPVTTCAQHEGFYARFKDPAARPADIVLRMIELGWSMEGEDFVISTD